MRRRLGRDVWHAARPLLARWPMMRVARMLGVSRQAVAGHLRRHPLSESERRALRAVPEVDAVEAVRALEQWQVYAVRVGGRDDLATVRCGAGAWWWTMHRSPLQGGPFLTAEDAVRALACGVGVVCMGEIVAMEVDHGG
jgi:hypothetical protein